MPLKIKIITTDTYTYSEHFMSVVILIDFLIFTSGMAHVHP